VLYYEKKLKKQGASCIIGVDEAGRGPLAGPVVAAAVILPADFTHSWLYFSLYLLLNDFVQYLLGDGQIHSIS